MSNNITVNNTSEYSSFFIIIILLEGKLSSMKWGGGARKATMLVEKPNIRVWDMSNCSNMTSTRG